MINNMAVNYFENVNDINEILDEVESQLTGNKVSKLSNPPGDRILVSTVGGDMEESTLTPNSVRPNNQLTVKNSLEKQNL